MSVGQPDEDDIFLPLADDDSEEEEDEDSEENDDSGGPDNSGPDDSASADEEGEGDDAGAAGYPLRRRAVRLYYAILA